MEEEHVKQHLAKYICIRMCVCILHVYLVQQLIYAYSLEVYCG